MSRFKTTFAILCIAFLFGWNPTAISQDLPGVPDSLYSEILGEMRAIQVIYPQNYDPDSNQPHDVVYVTDGEWHTPHVEYLRGVTVNEGFTPDFLIVALPNTYIENRNQRDRDFLGTSPDENSQSGETEKFISFLKDELRPYIESRYPVGGDNILYGHSYGGLFVNYVFLNHPELFDSFIATDPSLWWGNSAMIALAKERLKDPVYRTKALWIAGITNTAEGMGILAMDSVLTEMAPEQLHWKVDTFPNETHNSVRTKGIYDGLKFIYAGFDANVVFHPMNGILKEGATFPLFMDGYRMDVHYTTDGSEPTSESDELTDGVLITAPATVKARSTSIREKYAKTVVGHFEVGTELPAITKPEKAEAGGFRYSVFMGEWTSLPDFSKRTPTESGKMDENFDFNALPRENFGLVIDGYLEITEAGHYVFALDSDDGSRLTLGGKVLIDHDGLHGGDNYQSYVLPLDVGFYPIKFEYFQAGGDRGMDILYVRPGNFQAVQIPLEVQYSE